MTDEFDRALEALRAEATLEPLATAELPCSDEAVGGAREWVALAVVALAGVFGGIALDAVEGAPYARETTAAQREEGLLPGGVGMLTHGQDRRARDVVCVDLHDAGALPLGGDVHVDEGATPPRVYLRATEGRRAAVRLFGRDRELLVTVHPGGRVEVDTVRRPETHAAAPTIVDADGDALAMIVATPPPLARWLDGAAAPGWLTEVLAALATSDWALDRLAVAGLLDRLWTPTDPDLRARVILGDVAPPGRLAREWLRSLPAASLEAAARAAVREADRVRARLEDHLDHPSATLALAHRRDDLEGVRAALRSVGRDDSLAARLRHVDLAGRAAVSALPVDDDLRRDERLRCVHWSEPDAWWGTLVEA